MWLTDRDLKRQGRNVSDQANIDGTGCNLRHVLERSKSGTRFSVPENLLPSSVKPGQNPVHRKSAQLREHPRRQETPEPALSDRQEKMQVINFDPIA